jgi:glycogen phosphorylase
VRQLMAEQGATFEIAALASAAGNVFTTHTPVPAGNDAFAPELIAPYLDLLARGLGKTGEEVMKVGRVHPDKGGEFSMPVLAIRMADRYNGVSVLHGREARHMWNVLWPSLPVDEVPIDSVTNGVHLSTWVCSELADLYARRMGDDWADDGSDAARWARIDEVPDEELWSVHQRCRARLVQELRRRIRADAERRGRAADAASAESLLDPRALTIGFARRFATYKRGTLLLRDPERLERIVRSEGRPVQLVFSGKAHPQDFGGKELIKAIVRASRHPPFRGHILFVEDYDMSVARALVSGVDVWLNTPRRPLEASGTSGMKAAVNGALHASVLDGWWAEAWAGDNGFAIGRGEEYADADYGDRLEAQALYRLLEEEIVPLFYDRSHDGLPHGWIARMKRSIQSIGPFFNTARMVREYTEKAYVPAARRVRALGEEGAQRAKHLASWKQRVAAAWGEVRIERVSELGPLEVPAGSQLAVSAEVHLGSLSPGDVSVELYHGKLHGAQALPSGSSSPMRCAAELGGGRHRFEGVVAASDCGEHAYAVRVLPHHELLGDRFATRLVAWH